MEKVDQNKKDEIWNEYFYPNTKTFINKLGIKNDKDLLVKEAELSFNRLVELNENDITLDFDINHLCYINWYIFQDLYEWAGKIRNVNISTGSSNFADYSMLREGLTYEINLMKEDYKNVTSKESLSQFLAEYYTHLLELHPFRDGNGRTIREFLREFVLVKTKSSSFGEYELDWSLIDSKVIHDAVKNAKYFIGPLVLELNKALVKKENEFVK